MLKIIVTSHFLFSIYKKTTLLDNLSRLLIILFYCNKVIIGKFCYCNIVIVMQ